MSLYKRANSPYWWMQFRVNGKLIRRSTGTRRKSEAEKIHARVYSELLAQRWGIVEAKSITLRDFIRDHFLPYSETNKRESTVAKLRYHIKAILQGIPGDTIVSAVNLQTVERYKRYRINQGIQPSTLNSEINTLRAIMNYAMALNFRNERLDVRLLREPSAPPRALSSDEANRLLTAARQTDSSQSPRAYLIVAIPLYAGLRKQELFHLQWRDVDFEHDQILVRPKPGWSPKDYEQRAVPISAELRPDLERFYRLDGKRRTLHVVRTAGGRPYRTNANRILHTLATRAGLDHLSLHMFRHTFATNLVANGVDISVVSELLGHSTVRMTERYLHLASSHLHREMAKLSYRHDSDAN